MRKHDRTLWVALFLVCMLIGLSFSLNDYLFRNRLEGYAQESLWMLLRWDAIYWVMWVPLAPLLIFPVARRFPLGRRGLAQNLLITVAAGLGIVILHRFIYLLIATRFQRAMGHQTPFDPWLILYNLPLGFMSYSVILLINHVAYYAFSQREEAEASRAAAEASRLEAEQSRLVAELALKESQMSRLKAELKLRPHFIFNTLNSIATLVRKDPQGADEMIAMLGDFLDLTLNYADVQTVTLAEELEIAHGYLNIEKVRLKDGLRVYEDVEPSARTSQVPTFVLQPSLENAIKHRQSFEQVQIVISAWREDGRLCLQVRDNGDLWSGDGQVERTGIKNTRARLESAYGHGYRFDLRREPDGWTAARFEMPFITAAEEAAS